MIEWFLIYRNDANSKASGGKKSELNRVQSEVLIAIIVPNKEGDNS
jgi:hypothetical protein